MCRCLLNINGKDKYKLECGHIFHTNCIIQERKELKQTSDYISSIKQMNDLNKRINNKDRTIMNMKINLISNFPVILTDY